MTVPLRIGFIPLVDAAALIVAVDKGFAKAEGLDVSLVREVSWSNVRDKLNLGLFEAAHLLAPVAIASSLGLGHIKVPIAAPFNLGLNGNAITISPALHSAIMAEIDAALHGRQPRQRAGRCVLCRCALEFGRGRSRRRPYPAFRLGHPGARGREGPRCSPELVREES